MIIVDTAEDIELNGMETHDSNVSDEIETVRPIEQEEQPTIDEQTPHIMEPTQQPQEETDGDVVEPVDPNVEQQRQADIEQYRELLGGN